MTPDSKNSGPPEPPDLVRALREARRLAVEAGQSILASRNTAPDVKSKADGSPVSAADMAAHHVIVSGLEAFSPRFPVLSEESWGESKDFQTGQLPSWDTFWLVDPLDGTREFIAGRNDFTVNIALVSAGQPWIGVVYAPATRVLYYAARGLGAARSQVSGESRRLAPRTKSSAPVTAVVSRSHSDPATDEFLARYGISHTVRCGSSLKFCLVAGGAVDLYPRLGPTSIWDTAAGCAVASEAGCQVLDLQGRELDYFPGNDIHHNGFLVYSPHTFEPSF